MMSLVLVSGGRGSGVGSRSGSGVSSRGSGVGSRGSGVSSRGHGGVGSRGFSSGVSGRSFFSLVGGGGAGGQGQSGDRSGDQSGDAHSFIPSEGSNEVMNSSQFRR